MSSLNTLSLGGDETCLIADANGDVKIIGKFGHQNYEKKVANLSTMF